MKTIKSIFFLIILLCIFFIFCKKRYALEVINSSITEETVDNDYDQILSKYKNERIIFIDYSKPSFRKRLWVLDGDKILLNTYVSHGKESGFIYANDFSNKLNSNKSCIGVFQTGHTYHGKHGLSLTVLGLDSTNNNAFKRKIVFHSANYASEEFLLSHGYIGRSLGCFVTSEKNNKKIIDLVLQKKSVKVIVIN